MMTAGIRLRSVMEERHDDSSKYPTMASDEALLMPASVMEGMAEAIGHSLGKERSRVFKLLIEGIQLIGWGKKTIYDKKSGGIEGTIRVEVATLLRKNRSGSRCQLLRGFLTGSLVTTYNADDITCVEISCTGEGDSFANSRSRSGRAGRGQSSINRLGPAAVLLARRRPQAFVAARRPIVYMIPLPLYVKTTESHASLG